MTEENGHVNVFNIDIEKKMKESYLDYSMSVIVSRALPDVRDGMKPVHRRIIYAMQGQGLFPDRAYTKSARLVGDVMGKYHPHGDSAIYEATVRLAQDFNMRYPLVDGQGNFGNIDGDGAAAPRYTELRMDKLALEMLRDINKDTVDFQDNYDGREQEPTVLPSRFPNLIVNGSSGIAVGMATNMAPHNLRETIDGVIAYIDNPDITVEELGEIIKGPDFPTGANIMGMEGIKRAYRTGRGKITLRAVASIEEHKKRERIIVTEIPYQVNKSNLIQKIAEYVKDKKIEGISDLRDESDQRKGMRIVIELKRDANAEIVLNNLYKYTQLQTTFGIINLALVNGEPKVLGLRDLVGYYVDHQEEVVIRRTKFDLAKAEDRKHIVEGLLKAIDHIDEIIRIIRSSYSDALEKLMEAFGFSEVQAQSILDMRLKRLQGLEREKLQGEYEELLKTIKELMNILENRDVLFGVIKEEIIEIKEKFGDDRRTRILQKAEEINIEEHIEEEDVLITLTNDGYVKRIPLTSYRVQNRGGKGIMGLSQKENDFVDTLFITNTLNTILIFTNKGRVYSIRAYQIPEGSRQARGMAIINLLPLKKGETINAVIPMDIRFCKKYFLMATKQGLIKKIKFDEFENIRKTGIRAITLKDDDELINVRNVDSDADCMMITRKGQAIRFAGKNIRPIGRMGQGVKGINLGKDDYVVSMDIVDENQYLLIVSENGYGKKTLIEHYKIQNRGGKGVKTYKVSKKTGDIVSGKLVEMEDEILLVSLKGDILRINVRDFSTKGRDTMGVKIKEIKTDEDRIVAITKYEDIE